MCQGQGGYMGMGGMQPTMKTSMQSQSYPSQTYQPSQAYQAPAQQYQAPAQQAYQAPTQPLLRAQTVQDPAYANGGLDQYGYKLSPQPPTIPKPPQQPPIGPQPQTPFQPGQGGWGIQGGGVQNGGQRSPQSWSPSFMPGANEYLTHIMHNYMNPQQWSQIDPNNQLQSVGQMSGIPFNPSRWSY
jgi:hypothetical protein